MSGVSAGGCPYGVTGPCYGRCGRFTDGNGDGLCDFGGTTSTTATSSSSSDTSTSQSSSTDSSSSTDASAASGVDTSAADNGSNLTSIPDPDAGGLTGSTVDGGSNFHMLPVSLILLGAYLFTYMLFKKGILKHKQHKRLWNLLVTFGYLGTGITGVILVLLINMGIATAYNAGISYWHAELAILMVIGTAIHFHIYQKPIKKMFKTLLGFKSKDNAHSYDKNKKVVRSSGTSK